MENDEGADDSRSTLVRTGYSAFTFKEMAAFVRDIEARPLARLIADLDGLLALAESKFHLVEMVLQKRSKEDGAEREALRARVEALASDPRPDVAARARVVLARLAAQDRPAGSR